MADSPISGLPETTVVNNNDLILLEQNNTAKKIKGSNWKQYFNANVVSATAVVIDPTQDPSAVYNQNTHELTLSLPSSDYITDISKTGTSGLVDTYTVTTALGYTATFTVTNGGGSPASEIPLADVAGGSVGTSEKWAREDHQHILVYPNAANVGTTNPNLLDNPWFTVNQRASGSTYGESTSGNFLCDRWKLYAPYGGAASWAQSWHGITLNASEVQTGGDRFIQAQQFLPSNTITALLGKTITISYQGGSATATMPSQVDTSTATEVCRCNVGDNGWLIFGIETDGRGLFIIRAAAGKTIDINSVKLEVGNGSTLPYDARPEYCTELAKCQRYLYILSNVGNWQMPVISGWTLSATEARFAIRNPSAFAGVPSVIQLGTATYIIYSNATQGWIDSFAVGGLSADRQTAVLRVQGSGLTQYAPAVLNATGTNNAQTGLAFSCEI